MIPTQNCGMPRPTIGTARTTWSRAPCFVVAASVASGTAMSIESIVAVREQPQRHGQPVDDQLADVGTR